MKLYYYPGACSLAVHAALREAGLPFALERVDLATHRTDGGADFLAVNPSGQVPALVLDDGTVLTEAAALLQYVADRAPAASLAPPAGTLERHRVVEALNFVATELHKGMGALFDQSLAPEWRTKIVEKVSAKLAHLDRQLAADGHLAGGRHSVADLYAFTIVGWTRLFDIDLAPWPNVRAHSERVLARPAVREARAAEGLEG